MDSAVEIKGMNILKKSLVVFILPLLAFATAHKFYVSVTNVGYSEDDNALRITTRVFIDDFDNVLRTRYDFAAKLATKNESKQADAFIEKYVRAKFTVEINGKNASYTFIGKKYDADMMICYIEVPDVDLARTTSIQITNEILTDLFDDQKNIVHFKIDGKSKSFVLLKSDAKGMLNL
ncbi:hypothetical protein RQM65_13185 [Pricia sp. S334]|uniref:Peptidase E n=1 Tax=Pricia mediterranea TaxID=3076079 RepID=A0ABU3L8I3_9FLAO|nr:DUF6702 family protein [Pricia sp. S334]MDT7829621.1 hypothetical protein [Pricia sp. S334]